jgi:hypothetical protein
LLENPVPYKVTFSTIWISTTDGYTRVTVASLTTKTSAPDAEKSNPFEVILKSNLPTGSLGDVQSMLEADTYIASLKTEPNMHLSAADGLKFEP